MASNNFVNPFLHKQYNQVFDELFEPLCQYSYRITKDTSASEDIVQERFIYLWNNWERLSDSENLNAYLYLSVKNRSINCIKKRFQNLTSSLDDLNVNFADNNLPSPSELLEKKELEKILGDALSSLPDKCRIIFDLKRNAGLSNKEIAEHLNISIKTVESQTTIALKRIKIHIDKHWHTAIYILLSIFN